MALRVLHCPANVGNHPQGLARAERRVGLDSWCVDLESSWLGYPVDERVDRADGAFRFECERWRLLLRALRDYDVVHFNFGRTIMPTVPSELLGTGRWREAVRLPGRAYGRTLALRDLPAIARAGKVVAVTFQGDDARQGTGPGTSAFHRQLRSQVDPGYYTEPGDEAKRRAIAAFSRYADLIFYLNPDLGTFLPARAEFVPYAHVAPEEWTPPGDRRPGAVPTIVHAPSHRGIKGTSHVIEAVSRLRADGIAIDLRLVEGLPHEEARSVYEGANLVVDQLLVGWYGGLAVEAMALGKPVVCFVDDALAARYAPAALLRDLPVVRATPDTLYRVLKELLTATSDSYAELGRRGRAFVERWHDPQRIASRLKDAYLGRFESRRSRS